MSGTRAPVPSAAPSSGASRRGWHRLATFQRCPQAFAYEHVLKLKPLRESRGRALGTLVHLGLMHLYLGLAHDPRAQDPFEAMRRAHSRVAWCYEDAARLLEAYRERWFGSLGEGAAPRDGESFRTLAVEREYAVTLTAPGSASESASSVLHTQRFDLVVEADGVAEGWISRAAAERSGASGLGVWIIDHKTFGGRFGGLPSEWRMSGQFLSMDMIGRAILPLAPPHGFALPFKGVAVNALGTKSPHEFTRAVVPVDDTLRGPAAEALVEINLAIDVEVASGRDPWKWRRHHEACQGRYGKCDFWYLCVEGKRGLSEYVQAVDDASEVEA